MPICSNCSNPIDAKTKFCPYCDAPIEIEYSATKDSSGVVVSGGNQISALVKRYKDAYLVARITDGFGNLIKQIGIAIAILLIIIGALATMNAGQDATFAVGILSVIFGIFVGVLFYLLGVLVSAQGQILKASLDSAVNGSPFLTNEHRAKIMSLPEA